MARGLGLAALIPTGACSAWFSFTPERAAGLEAIETSAVGYQIDADSVQVLQSLPTAETKFVLVASTGQNPDGGREKCLYLYETRKGFSGWESASGGSCGLALNSRERFQGVAGSKAGSTEPVSLAYGLVNTAEITSAEAIWDDGELQQENVINGSFLIVRQKSVDVEQLLGFDDELQVVYTYDWP